MRTNNMRGSISREGWLWLQRIDGEVSKPQLCPFALEDATCCGDWCPHFSEPYERASQLPESDSGDRELVIDICHGKQLVFSELRDDRRERPFSVTSQTAGGTPT